MRLTDDNKQRDDLTASDQGSMSFSQMMHNTSPNTNANMISSAEH